MQPMMNLDKINLDDVFCPRCHDDWCVDIDNEEHRAAKAMGIAIGQDMTRHTYPGIGVNVDCADSMIDFLDELGYKVVKK